MARAPSDITQWQPGNSYGSALQGFSQKYANVMYDSAVWFKVAEEGKTSDGEWAATDLLAASDSIYTFTIPPKLKPGQYIVRHEMSDPQAFGHARDTH